METIRWTTESVFDSYEILETTFKTVSSHDIQTAILIPKGLKSGLHPVIYHMHGGFLVTAHGLFAPFFPKWTDKLALDHSAIIVSPDYRLLPSKNGLADLLEDLEDGWSWTKSSLNVFLKENAPGHEADFGHVLLAGGSAGGYCSVQLGFSHPNEFRALAIAYPLLDTKDKNFVTGPDPDEPTILRIPLEAMPSKEETLAWIQDKRQRPHTKDDTTRTPFAVAACHHGLFFSKILDNANLDRRDFNPIERLEAGGKLPPKIWLMQGDNDTTTHVRCAYRFVDELYVKLPEVSLRFDVVPGQDHAFDFNEETWASFSEDALGFVVEAWLGHV